LHFQLLARGKFYHAAGSLPLADLFLHEGPDKGAERKFGEIHNGSSRE
jgi:hypothetical protein